MPNDPACILILGGTREARELAERLVDDARFHVITSLAGRTGDPEPVAGEVRVGGFGGVTGLKEFVGSARIALVVDATHPFAAQISGNAALASAETGVPCFQLVRPCWVQTADDRWSHVADIEAAAKEISSGARALVTVGRQEVAPFFARQDIHVVARMIEPLDTNLPDHAEIILARPPFSQQQERRLLEDRRITVLVSKNSGGGATYGKIKAARELGVPVIMIGRPVMRSSTTASSVDGMMTLIGRTLD